MITGAARNFLFASRLLTAAGKIRPMTFFPGLEMSMRALFALFLALPTGSALADDYDSRFSSTLPTQPAAPREQPSQPAFRITQEGSLVRPPDERRIDSGNPLLDSDETRERANCQRIRQRVADQGKFPSFGCD
ncbi:hypothetical protein [Pseudomonas sp. DP-17]|uniref:hypothetical protein n=1 Tax=Pseudomonas sp. DP-17 TaxID=1580486 RepID=UPI001EFBEF13|nr:hypothetical protein [Pseudomonas sp. DP-17]MCG8906551.1 hypothetical protein [Pseudomonas sp. DP-17]